MPTYEYACATCGNHWEEIQKITEPAIDVCPKCHKKSAQRQISGGSFILKGGGWYADLYSSSKPSKKDDGTKSTPAGESKSETKSDATSTKESSPAPASSSTSTPAATPGSSSTPKS